MYYLRQNLLSIRDIDAIQAFYALQLNVLLRSKGLKHVYISLSHIYRDIQYILHLQLDLGIQWWSVGGTYNKHNLWPFNKRVYP